MKVGDVLVDQVLVPYLLGVGISILLLYLLLTIIQETKYWKIHDIMGVDTLVIS